MAEGSMPNADDWAAAAAMNSSEAINTLGIFLLSRFFMSCTLHDVQEPQSAKASMTRSHSVAMV